MGNNDNTPVKKDKTNCTWSRDDEATLVFTLKKAKEDMKWGDNNPKEVTWTLCVAALSGSEKISGGAAKNAKVIKNRWQRVRAYISCIVCESSCLSSAETGIFPTQGYVQTFWMGMGLRKEHAGGHRGRME
jgi:hypothetical protein